MVVRNRTWVSLAVICIVAMAMPGAVAWALACVRLGACRTSVASDALERVANRAPADWIPFTTSEEWKWVGVTLRRFTPGQSPDCRECDVALWQIQAGWPVRCMEAYWNQDYRHHWLGTHGTTSPFDITSRESPSAEATNRVDIGINAPGSVKDAPSTAWVPIRPLTLRYAVNAALYFFAFLGFGACARSAWNRCSRGRRVRKGQCPCCGYPIVGLTQAQCPECGTAISKHLVMPGT